ncbi:uncharacterized protein LOC106645397 [Copidosoma floridanum]|uniref:uncharacterized protein LOC106645397 n=1 Tax=Copidosoma floridanum TaxID=29053 RepID=UPI0006C96826|nr:uncharacterized protein LOC106645397 [Copidosoma floridanum]
MTKPGRVAKSETDVPKSARDPGRPLGFRTNKKRPKSDHTSTSNASDPNTETTGIIPSSSTNKEMPQLPVRNITNLRASSRTSMFSKDDPSETEESSEKDTQPTVYDLRRSELHQELTETKADSSTDTDSDSDATNTEISVKPISLSKGSNDDVFEDQPKTTTSDIDEVTHQEIQKLTKKFKQTDTDFLSVTRFSDEDKPDPEIQDIFIEMDTYDPNNFDDSVFDKKIADLSKPFTYNMSVHAATNFTPYELVFGRLARLPLKIPKDEKL